MAQEKIPEFLREKVTEAQARLKAFEDEAQKILQEVKERGKASRKELDDILARVSAGELANRAQGLQKDVIKRLDELQHRVLQFVGVATREQVADLSGEIARLAKKVEKLARKRIKRPEANA